MLSGRNARIGTHWQGMNGDTFPNEGGMQHGADCKWCPPVAAVLNSLVMEVTESGVVGAMVNGCSEDRLCPGWC